jgi:hypothetical protein
VLHSLVSDVMHMHLLATYFGVQDITGNWGGPCGDIAHVSLKFHF